MAWREIAPEHINKVEQWLQNRAGRSKWTWGEPTPQGYKTLTIAPHLLWQVIAFVDGLIAGQVHEKQEERTPPVPPGPNLA